MGLAWGLTAVAVTSGAGLAAVVRRMWRVE
jgi:hypothetical protein